MSDSVRPCPWCGHHRMGLRMHGDENELSVSCDRCGAIGPCVDASDVPVEEQDALAIAAWNSRA